MKKIVLLLNFFLLSMLLQAQYQFPECNPAWDPNKDHYVQGEKVSFEGLNYTAKHWTSAQPGDQSWESNGACGDGGLGPDYTGNQRIIGYLPTWIEDYDIKNNFNPEVATNINISFLMFKQNNNDYNSSDFASIAFNEREQRKVDSVLTDCNVLSKAKAKNVKVSVALGGATDYAFLWLMTKYQNNDQKLEEIANLLANYITSRDLDGIDLDLECWWADPAISGTSDQGGRTRGDKWGGQDQGPHPAGVGLKKLTQKLRAKLPNKLISAAVFGAPWYGNNYDAGMTEYMDWLGLMSYDFTGSWNESSFGPHSALYKVPLNTYPRQSADNPIYAAQDALEYWLGIAQPEWNHAGGHGVKKSKLVIGVPLYGYDFSERKPNNGNGFKFVPYKDIIAEFPNAATSYDPKDSRNLGGHIGLNGKDIYYNTPKLAAEKIRYTKNYGHQGVIVWELTQDTDYNNSSSIMKAINEEAGNTDPINNSPVITWEAPTNGQVIESETLPSVSLKAKAVDSDGTITSFSFKHNNTTITATQNGSSYTADFTPSAFGDITITAVATDDKNATSQKSITFTVKQPSDENTPPVISQTTPPNNEVIEQTELSQIGLWASVTDNDGTNNTVGSVVFMVNGVTHTATNTSDGPIYTLGWTPPAFDTYTFKIIATDNEGLSSETTTSFIIKQKSTSTCDGIAEWSSQPYPTAGTEVSYNGKVYKNKWYAEPTETPGSSNVWEYVRECDGSTSTYCGSEEWSASIAYNTGETVHYDQKIYEAKWWTQNNVPNTSNEWQFVSDCVVNSLNRSNKITYSSLIKDIATLQIDPAQPSWVRIDVYSFSGRLVKTILNEKISEQSKMIQKDLSDLESGLYIYKININGKTYGKKLVKE
ncbi:glycosyl hydrolase family 18 protein [Aquimarina sp. 2201CG5-10]|uniref:glycosyl hydrolase family 18 protein n=1 Tax=Aquimarina callyspongiae TaxID=3098150 RepID=UPI002AB332E3|nr:glycosyl hydrolase family 18 protein [Aquimarina sp. 2201CG5-10]MDY8136978.1 glycosyl hydrolase family 18 protein [Aquimarina sp. 2201CG5-10]